MALHLLKARDFNSRHGAQPLMYVGIDLEVLADTQPRHPLVIKQYPELHLRPAAARPGKQSAQYRQDGGIKDVDVQLHPHIMGDPVKRLYTADGDARRIFARLPFQFDAEQRAFAVLCHFGNRLAPFLVEAARLKLAT